MCCVHALLGKVALLTEYTHFLLDYLTANVLLHVIKLSTLRWMRPYSWRFASKRG